MTSASTVETLCNRALGGIGARATIQALDEGSTEAVQCSIYYASTYQQVARSAHWNCLRKQMTLSLLAAAKGTPENPDGTTLPLPPVPWLYQYQAPSDNLDVRYLIPSLLTNNGNSQLTTVGNQIGPWMVGGGMINFAVAYAEDVNKNPLQVILTNLSQAVCVYTVDQPNPLIFDSLFEQALVSALSAFLVPALSLNLQLMQICIASAERAISTARVRDGDEGVTTQDHVPDWMTARNSGTRYGSGWNGNNNGYTNVCWPG